MNRAIIFALDDEDKLLIPVKPTSVDKIASNPTLRLIKQAKLHGKKFKAATFVSLAHRSRAVTVEIGDYLLSKEDETGVKVLSSVIYDKATIADAFRPRGRGLEYGQKSFIRTKRIYGMV